MEKSLYIRIGCLCKKTNSKHISLSFSPETSLEAMPPLVEKFTVKLAELSGVHLSRIATGGFLFAHPAPHAHLLAVSDKCRRTGKSIGNMPSAAVQELFRWWATVAGGTGQWRSIYDPRELVSYLVGRKNALREGQTVEILPITNESLLKRLYKRLEKRKKIETTGVHGHTGHGHPSPV